MLMCIKTRLSFTREKIKLIPLIILFKLMLELSFWKVLTLDSPVYVFSFDVLKYFNSIIGCTVCYYFLDVNKKKASSFFTLLIYITQIIPISAVYALTTITSPIYYNILVLSFLLCEILVGTVVTTRVFRPNKLLSRSMLPLFAVLSLGVVLILIAKNGAPSLQALDVYSVYDMRADNDLGIGKYLGHVLRTVTSVFLPILLVNSMLEKKYRWSFLWILLIFVIYLYSGNKITLLSIPLCIAGVVWAKKDDCLIRFFRTMLLAFSALCFLSIIWPKQNTLITRLFYSLFIRRLLLVPAILKFYHFDYFTTHPHLALYGAIPVAINPYIPEYHTVVQYQLEIGELYLGSASNNAGTGFLVEGFARFGYVGMVLCSLLLAWILHQFDAFQSRTSYPLTISYFIFPVFALTDGSIIATLFFGVWFFVLLVLYHYSEQNRSNGIDIIPAVR